MIVPGLNQGTNITNSSFIANWSEPILGRTERYFLDVSTNNEFTSFVSGYNGLNVGLSNSYNVTGLSNNTTYYYRVRSNKNNLGDVGAIQYPKYSTVTLTTLAVELLEFNVYESLNHVYLNWKTASELNNHKFEIFKSYDCKNWIYIAEVKGYKNSSILMNYDFVDLTSNQSSLIYYKLNQIDLDGTVNELPIKSILINNDKIISFSPNPTNTDVFIKNGCEISAINLIDKNGVVVVNMSNCENLNSIDLSVFPNGIYYVKIFKKDGAIQFDKLIKY
jgi:hypothetical protein